MDGQSAGSQRAQRNEGAREGAPHRRGGTPRRCGRERRRRRSRRAPPAAAAHAAARLGGDNAPRTLRERASGCWGSHGRPRLRHRARRHETRRQRRRRAHGRRRSAGRASAACSRERSELRKAGRLRSAQNETRNARGKHESAAPAGCNGLTERGRRQVWQVPSGTVWPPSSAPRPLVGSPEPRDTLRRRAGSARREAVSMSRFPQAAPAAVATAASGAGGSAVRPRASGASGAAGAPAAASGRPAGRVRALETPVAVSSLGVLGAADSLLAPLLRRKSVLDSGARRAAAQTKLLWTCGPCSRRCFCAFALAPRAPRRLTRPRAPPAAQPDGAAVALLPVRPLRARHAAAGQAPARAVCTLTLSLRRAPVPPG